MLSTMISSNGHWTTSFKISRSLSTARIRLVNFSYRWRSFEDIVGERRRILMLRERDWTCSQREEHLMHVDTICPRMSLGITGRIWRKSPQKQNIIPPNDRRFLWIFFIIRLTISNVYRCCIDILSQNINWVSHRNSIRW